MRQFTRHHRQLRQAGWLLGLCTVTFLGLSTVGGCPGDDNENGNGNMNENDNDNDNDNDDDDGPTIDGPDDLTVECDGAGNIAELEAWLEDVTFTEGCGGAEVQNDFEELGSACGATGSVTVTWVVTDDCGDSAEHTATFTIEDTTPPEVTPPDDISVTCGEAGVSDALHDWLDSIEAEDGCGETETSYERDASAADCTAQITWTVTDACGNESTASASYTTDGDSTPPEVTLPAGDEVTLECGVDTLADAGVHVQDDCDALLHDPTLDGDVDFGSPGDYTVTVSAADACGNESAAQTLVVHVVDTLPPEVTVADPNEIWPPNHDYVTLTLADCVESVDDACAGELDVNSTGNILSIYSDEPENDNGDGNTEDDIVIVGNAEFRVRAERQGGGNGRVYGVLFEVVDEAGNRTEQMCFVHVPHDQSGDAPVDDGPDAGYAVTP